MLETASENICALLKQIDPEGLEADAALAETILAERSFHAFVLQAWAIIEPVVPFMDGWHIRAICRELQHLHEDGAAPDILLNCPPGFMKSILISVLFPCWVWGPGNRPDTRWLFASYNGSFASRDAGNRRKVLGSSWFQERWGDRYSLVDYQKEKLFWRNDRGGFMRTTTTGGGLGEHPDYAVLDDIENLRMVLSKSYRRQVAEWIDATIGARGIARGIRRIIAQQRLHDQDATAHWLKKNLPVTHICLPLHYDAAHPHRYKHDERTVDGKILWPELFTEARTKMLERSLAPMWHAAQLAQNPQRRGGKVLKEEWLSFYSFRGNDILVALDDDGAQRGAIDRRQVRRFATIDTAETDKTVATESHSYSVCQIWDYWPAQKWLFLRHVWRDQVGWDGLVDCAKTVCATWKPSVVVIEDKSFGSPLASVLRHEGLSVSLVMPRDGKLSRSTDLQTKLREREIFLPYDDEEHPHPWVTDLVNEWLEWTGEKGETSDQIDTAAMAAHHVLDGVEEVLTEDAIARRPIGWSMGRR